MTATAAQNGLLAAALRYAELGYPVFPCVPAKKTPITPTGFHDATTDPDAIRAWWQEHPQANIGLPTAGLVVVDVDGQENGWPGNAEHAYDLASAGALGLTANGGKHYVYREPPGKGYRNTAGRLAEHVDTRANGGYIVVPPSILDEGRRYAWADGMELATPHDKLPTPPPWLVQQLDALAKGQTTAPATAGETAQEILEGNRNATLTSIAGKLRRAGLGPDEILSALLAVNARRCSPSLPRSEVEAIAKSVARYEPGGQPPPREPERVDFAGIPCSVLDSEDYTPRFLVDGVFVEGQPTFIAAPTKTNKTLTAIELSVSLATARPFLGHFEVLEAARVGYFSGEGGLSLLQDYGRRIAKSKGLRLADVPGLVFCEQLPQLAHLDHLDGLERFARDHELRVLLFDPLYLGFPGDNAANLLMQGKILGNLNRLCVRAGCTPVFVHHTKRNTGRDPFGPPELLDLSWAGFSEFAGGWILLGRRQAYNPDEPGEHRLWLSIGGRAGNSSLHALDVHEGRLCDPGGRRWETEVKTPAEAREAAEGRREASKAAKAEARLEADRKSVVQTFTKLGAEMKTTARDATPIGHRRFDVAFASLVEDGSLVPAKVKRSNGQSYDGWTLAPEE